jgi:hypothetical protein
LKLAKICVYVYLLIWLTLALKFFDKNKRLAIPWYFYYYGQSLGVWEEISQTSIDPLVSEFYNHRLIAILANRSMD